MHDTVPEGVARTGVDSAGLLHELFQQTAAEQPEAIAIECGGTRLTYAELEKRSNQLAHFLREQRVRKGDCVALLLPRGPEAYPALLGILKAGAAYVPLDPDYPAERIGFILSDCQARCLVTTNSLTPKASGFSGRIIDLQRDEAKIAAASIECLGGAEVGLSQNDLCYIIYTSGTTGRPKGVQIEHRSACHLVATEKELFQVPADARVYQGFSLAFDASVEEMWLAFTVGATLVVGTSEMVHAGAALASILTRLRVTVLSCVPTLLAMMEEDIPTLKLLILGGEVCPADLVKRWWKPGRRMVNTYGPTEATVIATYADCHPDQPVTIGRAIPGYEAVILGEDLNPISVGSAGELCLGGTGLARGYLGRKELTAEKFIIFAANGERAKRLYRTGDLVKCNSNGDIEFLGRIDGQVKLRGFRIELGEIEAVLRDCPEVRAAAVALREDTPGMRQLVAYVVSKQESQTNFENLRVALRQKLPAYMVPAIFEPIACLPTLSSGKIDRTALPPPKQKQASATVGRKIVPPANEIEAQIADVWSRLFVITQVSVTEDFFLDLGGHSLLAARMVSELRQKPLFARLSMLDIYKHPTIEGLARNLLPETQKPLRNNGHDTAVRPPPLGTGHPASGKTEPTGVIPFWRHFFCGTAQLISLIFICSFFALQWLAPYLTYTILIEEEFDFIPALLGAFASLVLIYPLMLAIPIAVKWLVIGRYKAGSYPLWGSYYFRFWFATTIEAAVPVGYLAGTPLLNIYLRLMGAKIGARVHLDSDSFAIYDLLSIGEDSSINVDSNLLGYTVEDGHFKVGSVTIGKRCFVGARAGVRENCAMEDDSALEDLSLLSHGQTIRRGETWQGSPAERFEGHEVASAGRHQTGMQIQPAARRFLFGVLHGIGLLIFPVLVVAALFPGIVVMNHLNYLDPYYWYLLLAPLVGFSFIVILCLEIAALKWLVLGRVKAGDYPVSSFYYLRKWFVAQTMDLSLDILGPLYASVYLTPWYKLLGAKLGRGAEISTASFISPDLLTIGAESFIADSVSLGAPRVRNGVLTVGPNVIGKRSFIGNSAMLPPGAAVGDSVLIGCLSLPPRRAEDALREDSAWLGSPAIFLPQREKLTGFGADTTFNPTAFLRVQRATIEFVRVIAPSTGFIILLSLLFSTLLLLHDNLDLIQTLLWFPVLYLGCGVAATLVTIISKWLLVQRYKPGEKPLWNTFVWRNELINALHEHLAEPFLIGALTGTPFICWYFRLLGARIGRRVYMETTDFSEFDLADIGDEAALNADCTIQTHLFEDRVMKMSTVRIGAQCKVGAGSLVLYDTVMEQSSVLGDLSLLMKGEVLPAGTSWEGIPARANVESPGGKNQAPDKL